MGLDVGWQQQLFAKKRSVENCVFVDVVCVDFILFECTIIHMSLHTAFYTKGKDTITSKFHCPLFRGSSECSTSAVGPTPTK